MDPSPSALRQENRRLQQLVARYRERIRRLSTHNESLLRTVNDLSCEAQNFEEVHDVEMADNNEDKDSDSSLPMWDSIDCVFRCHDCSWEVLDGMCQHCEKEYDTPDDEGDGDSLYEENAFFDGILSTLSAAELPERVLAPRGDTPQPPDIPWDIPAQYIFPGERNVYQQLRQRGATRKMCTTFSMRFRPEVGVIAVLTPEIKETFAGPAMLPEDKWEVWLGREVRLDPEDEDGSDFIIGLLEDVLLFSERHFTRRSSKWETVRLPNQAHLWVTRPTTTFLQACQNLSGDSTDSDSDENKDDPDDRLLEEPFVESGPTIHRDEYEMTDVEDVETDDDGDDDVADPGYGINPRYDDFNWSDGEDNGLCGSDSERAVADVERVAELQAIGGEKQMKVEDGQATGRIAESPLAGPSHVPQTLVPSETGTQEDDGLDSPVESDFDSDEVLSGDEDVLQGRGRGY